MPRPEWSTQSVRSVSIGAAPTPSTRNLVGYGEEIPTTGRNLILESVRYINVLGKSGSTFLFAVTERQDRNDGRLRNVLASHGTVCSLTMSVQTDRDDRLAESEIFHILGNDRRRAIVQQLADGTERLEVSAVATEIASRESESTPVPNNLYKSVYVSLQQTHLPQLEEDDVIEYDSEAKAVSRGSQFQDVLGYIDRERNNHESTLKQQLVVSVLGLVLIALAGLELPISLDPVLLSVAVLLVIAATSLYQLLT